MEKKEVAAHLEGRKQQLVALIAHLKSRGTSHPQYSQLENCQSELKTVISQLKRLG